MTGAGDLIHRVSFEKRDQSSDGAGGTTTAYSAQFTVSAVYIHMRGGEAVMAGRLEGRHSLVVRVRSSANTRLVTTDWRMRDMRTGEVFNVRDITRTEDRAWIDFLGESGVAA